MERARKRITSGRKARAATWVCHSKRRSRTIAARRGFLPNRKSPSWRHDLGHRRSGICPVRPGACYPGARVNLQANRPERTRTEDIEHAGVAVKTDRGLDPAQSVMAADSARHPAADRWNSKGMPLSQKRPPRWRETNCRPRAWRSAVQKPCMEPM